MTRVRTAPRPSPALMIGALGVVFGDIGTSVLYAMQAALRQSPDRPPDRTVVFGLTAMLVWSLVLIVAVLYTRLLLRTDNRGDGGLLALVGLLQHGARGRTLTAVTLLGAAGAAMFLGDSIITPAISVLSAVEGMELIGPAFASAAIPLVVVILVALFAVQRFGTSAVGRFFGPVMLLWFLTIGVLGAASLIRTPAALAALSPHWIVLFVAAHPLGALPALGAVVLAVTGAESLYADMGHFGRPAVAGSWFAVVLPTLLVCYLGQAALVLRDPRAATAPMFLLGPEWARMPLVVLATVATVIASQSVISGAFTVVHQAARLGLLPRVRAVHTSAAHARQIYLPAVNRMLALAVLVLTVGFGSSAALAAAYGVAVTVTIAITTTLLMLVQRRRRSRLGVRLLTAALAAVVLLFLAGAVPKIAGGAWVPLAVATVLLMVMTTYRSGRARLLEELSRVQPPLTEFAAALDARTAALVQAPGTGIFLTRDLGTVPLALETMIDQVGVRHEKLVLVCWETARVPTVDPGARTRLESPAAPAHMIAVTVRFGYREPTDLPAALRQARDADGRTVVDTETAVYYLSMAVPVVSEGRTVTRWRRRLFVVLTRLTGDPTTALALPRDRTIVVGRELTL